MAEQLHISRDGVPGNPMALRVVTDKGVNVEEDVIQFDPDTNIITFVWPTSAMTFGGSYDPAKGPYPYNSVVRDGEFTMICKNEEGCSTKPAPQAAGDPFYVYDGLDPTTQVSSKSLLMGTRYTVTNGGFITGYRIHAVAGNHYEVYLVDDPEGAVIARPLFSLTASSTGWKEFSVAPTIVVGGTSLDLVAVVHEPDAVPTTWEGDWNYSRPNNVTAPLSGHATHSNKDTTVISFSKFDANSGDRTAELAALTIGDVINGDLMSWSIQAIVDQGTYFDFSVAPASQDTAGLITFTFEIVTSSPITHIKDPDYWLTSPFNGKGLYANPASYDGVSLDDNGYGVDILIQEAVVSEEWELVSA